jgi:aspartyl-tRNA(Asn)/glutamyl-tRNA(Gln) amidotransferase subunit A
MYLNDLFTIPGSLAGNCSMSVPAGFAASGDVRLPVGVQFICDAYREDTLLRVGKAFEQLSAK